METFKQLSGHEIMIVLMAINEDNIYDNHIDNGKDKMI